jgi:hypothetical protein
VLTHFLIAIMLIHFFIAIVLSRSSLVQYSVISHCYSVSHFLLLQPQSFIRLHSRREAARSGEVRMREVARSSVADAWD